MELTNQPLAAAVIAETTNCLNSCLSKIRTASGN